MEVSDIVITQQLDIEPSVFEQCDECDAPVDHAQRYCVSCGTRRRHVPDPAARQIARSTSKAPIVAPAIRSGRGRKRGSHGLGATLAVAIIPVALGVGVLIGRASNGGDAKLIAALKAQKPEVITTGAAAAGTALAGATPVVALKSTFPLQSGYSVEIETVATSGLDQAKVNADENAARSKGATAVGLIVAGDFRVTPTPPAGTDVIYSGAYKTKADAEKALAKLHKKFPKGVVIQVQPPSTTVAGAGQALNTTVYGTAHQIAGAKITQAQLNQGRQIVQKIQNTQGNSYVQAQRGLPDSISIP